MKGKMMFEEQALWFQGKRSMLFTTAVALTMFAACTETENFRIGFAGEGEGCDQISDCVAGLDCVNDVCVPIDVGPGGKQRGEDCIADNECIVGLFCGSQNVCSVTDGRSEGQSCTLSSECDAGLVCSGASNTCVQEACVAGSLGTDEDCPGAACTADADCRTPLICAPDILGTGDPRSCVTIPFFLGADCLRSDIEGGAFRVYYEVPSADFLSGASSEDDDGFGNARTQEFYRLPFPNDIRVRDGAITLAGHPSPGEVLGIDVTGLYLRSIEEDNDGFDTTAPVLFRLTDVPRNGSLCLSPGSVHLEQPEPGAEAFCVPGSADPTVYLINIDPDHPQYNQRIPVQMSVEGERGQFVCQNRLAIAPLDGQPLDQETIYAAVITTGLENSLGDSPIQDQDFARILTGLTEGNITAEVLAATEPLRDWLADSSITTPDPSTLAAATVFTTGRPDRFASRIRDAVLARPAPEFDAGAFACSAAPAAPVCHGGGIAGRNCDIVGGGTPNYVEVQGTYQAPVYQGGVRPYPQALGDQPSGQLQLAADGSVMEVAEETMCFSLTIPATGVPGTPDAEPPRGWPVIIYAHGTGGNYRSLSGNADGLIGLFSGMGFATIGFDNIMHGPRQDPSFDPALWTPNAWQLDDDGVGRLFFNIMNPRAARDNILQGSADLFHLVRLVRSATVQTTETGTTSFDPDQVYFVGHSQGTVIAPPFLAEETHLKGAVLSGAGAELALSILNKKEPVDLAEAAGVVFGDRGLTRLHPMLGILTTMFGPSDAMAYTESILRDPPQGRVPAPLLQFSGVGDSFTPDPTQAALIRALGMPIVGPAPGCMAPADCGNPNFSDPLSATVSPASDTVAVSGGGSVTAGVLRYSPGSGDGHFVMFNHPDAVWALGNFLEQVAAEAPRIERSQP